KTEGIFLQFEEDASREMAKVAVEFNRKTENIGARRLHTVMERDEDDDNDGVVDHTDNCPIDSNENQDDYDGDGSGDTCDDDVDGDGVLNGDDACGFTSLELIVNPDDGCSLDQLCPCDGPRGINRSWRGHGKYVVCVVRSARSFVRAGLISRAERRSVVFEAAQSECGKRKLSRSRSWSWKR
ncbi:MAG: hypothetical protein D3924_10445, partial [Candidatus Electrothrix sp. AR4]|nr:hypothetical protein [Candidatus Electrothrix sp. AR4]